MGEEPEIIPPARRSVPRVVEAITTVPWAITEEALNTIVAIALRENDASPEALEAYRGRAVAGHDLMTLRGQTAVMTIKGPLFRYGDFFTAISGAATYDGIAQAIAKAKDDPQVRNVLFAWDSPGGEVNGCAELADMIADLSAAKPTESYVGGQCCSAAYWLASATSKITVDSTAQLGSIGVRLGIRDTSERDAKSGVRTIEFVSSNAPNKRMDWSTDSGRARIQKMADQLEGVFIAAVAKNRGVSTEEVIAKFGQGGVEIGADAVKAGLADALGSFESVVAKLAAGSGRTLQGRTFAMNLQNQQPGATGTFTQADIDAAVARATAEAKATAEAEGAKAAQARISAILESDEGKANAALANHFAFKTTMSVDDAKAALAAAGPARAETPTPPAPAQSGQRSQDAAGGLALSNALDKGGEPEKPKAAAISPTAIYNKRREQAAAHAKR